MSLLHKLLEQTGERWLPRDAGEDGKRHYMKAIADTNELRRIVSLPRRRWEDNADELAEILTGLLKSPRGTMKLWPAQAAALFEISEQRGALCPIKVGRGKTLISLLAATILEAQRPILLVPANLRDKTLALDLPELRKHWKIHPDLRVIGYSEISLEKNKEMLFDIQPDVLICDECHYLRHPRAGRTRRVARYLKSHPLTSFVAMSGTVAQKSFVDWAHLAEWALGSGSPLPRSWNELTEWSLYFDVTVPDEQRPLAGALKKLCQGEESVHEAWRRRFAETPGIVVTEDDDVAASLTIVCDTQPWLDLEIQEALNKLRNRWETPDGDPIVNAVDLWRHAREITLGFYYKWDPPPPRDWMDARREWKKYVREVLKHNRHGLDTELQVWNESKRNPHPEWSAWNAIKDAFKPNSVAVWLSDSGIKYCAEWLRDNDGIVWTGHQAFGRALSDATNYPYYGAGNNEILLTTQPKIIASIQAHGEGKNLQRYSRALVAAPSSNGKTWEQLLGRLHRSGQDADEVVFDVILNQSELIDSFEAACQEADYVQTTYGNRQKLRYAEIIKKER